MSDEEENGDDDQEEEEEDEEEDENGDSGGEENSDNDDPDDDDGEEEEDDEDDGRENDDTPANDEDDYEEEVSRRSSSRGAPSRPVFPSTSPPLTSLKTTRSRKGGSISAPTGGKPKFRLGGGGEDDQEDDDEEEEPILPVKKRAQTFGNSNTSAAEALEQQARPFKNLDVGLRLKVIVKGPAVDKKAVKAELDAKPKFSIPAPAAAAPSSSSSSTSTAATTTLTTTILPSLYIRFKPEWTQPHDYEYTVEDEVWLKSSSLCGKSMTMELVETMLNDFEILTGTSKELITSAKAFTSVCQVRIPGISRAASDELHHYWSTKRMKNKRSLLRRFWPVYDESERSPTATFRVREFENKYRLRRKRMGEWDQYDKLATLKKDFSRLRELVLLMARREKFKAMEAELIHAEYLEKLGAASGGGSVPPARPACLDVPLPPPVELEDMENLYYDDGRQQRSSRAPFLPPSSSRVSSSSAAAQAAAQAAQAAAAAAAAQAEKKKSTHKRRHEGAYLAIQPVSMGPQVPYYFPEPLYFRDDPVPLPLYLLDDPELLRQHPYRPIKQARTSSQEQQGGAGDSGRSRRRGTGHSALLSSTTDVFQPSATVRAKLEELFARERPGEEEFVERIDVALLRANEGPPPKFQLLV